ncbi:MAG TPA: glycosyltransferase family 2 protein [Pyrinomonadaceae bacterium]|jgi:glycosyltransferase involved in cell wall biosynthesis|nr:glycosyltransferase family 2 protein [Pyrinomonadaceae bacterium]
MSAVLPISVLIPALNAERFLGEAIASVRAQTRQVAEIIVVDNGCTDRTAQIAADLGAIVVAEAQRGISSARNAGLRRCTGQWIALLDSDDQWDAEKIELQWAAIQACPDAGIVSCYFRIVEDGAVILENTGEQAEQRWAGYSGRTLRKECSYFPKIGGDFFPRFLPSCSDALLRREVFATVGLFDETILYSEDFEFFMRVLARYPLAIVEKTLISCRRHDQKHTRNLRAMRDATFSIANYMMQHPEKYPAGIPQAFRDRLKHSFSTIEHALHKQEEMDRQNSGTSP